MGSKRNRNRQKATRPPAYLAEVLRLRATLEPGSVNHVVVDHDRDCSLLAGAGGCDCSPVVRLVKPS